MQDVDSKLQAQLDAALEECASEGDAFMALFIGFRVSPSARRSLYVPISS